MTTVERLDNKEADLAVIRAQLGVGKMNGNNSTTRRESMMVTFLFLFFFSSPVEGHFIDPRTSNRKRNY